MLNFALPSGLLNFRRSRASFGKYDAALLQRLGGVFGIGWCREKISARRDEELNLAVMHFLDSLDCVGPVPARRTELKFAADLVTKGVGHSLPHPHRAIALNVRMPA